MKDAKAEDIFIKIKQFFVKNNIPYKENLIGFASDGANVMAGKNNSVMFRLRQEIPNIFLIKCICHSFHLAASYACQKIPRGIEDLARDVHNYFSNSPKRVETFKEFQSFTNTKIHQILHPSQTRWLSLESVVNRILEQYQALILFFTDASVNDRILAADNILVKLKDPLTIFFFRFLQFALPFFTKINREMQSETPKIHELYSNITAVYKTILECFIKNDVILKTPVFNINYKDPKNFLPLSEIYLGAHIVASIHTLEQEQAHLLRTRCLDFFVEACIQINLRFDFNNEILQNMRIINPLDVIEKKFSTIIPLAKNFPNLVNENDLQILDTEYRLLRNTEVEWSVNISTENFWNEVGKKCYADNTPMFNVLTNFVFNMLILPHSSANVERIFSQVNLLKSQQRNKLSTASISGLLHTKTFLALKSANCYSVTFDKNIVKMHNKQMYKKAEELSDSD